MAKLVHPFIGEDLKYVVFGSEASGVMGRMGLASCSINGILI
jgi:hypothetical protein